MFLHYIIVWIFYLLFIIFFQLFISWCFFFFYRNEKEICLLIHYLYQIFPEDTIIFPCNHFKDEYLKLTENVVISMKSEIDLLISSFNIHNVSDELRKNYPKLMSSHKVGTVSIPKAAYQRIRTVLVKKECITDSVFKNLTSTCV